MRFKIALRSKQGRRKEAWVLDRIVCEGHKTVSLVGVVCHLVAFYQIFMVFTIREILLNKSVTMSLVGQVGVSTISQHNSQYFPFEYCFAKSYVFLEIKNNWTAKFLIRKTVLQLYFLDYSRPKNNYLDKN